MRWRYTIHSLNNSSTWLIERRKLPHNIDTKLEFSSTHILDKLIWTLHIDTYNFKCRSIKIVFSPSSSSSLGSIQLYDTLHRVYWSVVIKCQPNIFLWLINCTTSATIRAIRWSNAVATTTFSNCGCNGVPKVPKASNMPWIVLCNWLPIKCNASKLNRINSIWSWNRKWWMSASGTFQRDFEVFRIRLKKRRNWARYVLLIIRLIF